MPVIRLLKVAVLWATLVRAGSKLSKDSECLILKGGLWVKVNG